MLKTTDMPSNNSYIIENITNPATISIKDEENYLHRNATNNFTGTDNIFINSSSSNCSKFFEGFLKIKSQETLQKHTKGVHSLNISIPYSKREFITHKRINPSVRKVAPIIDSKELFKINDLLLKNKICSGMKKLNFRENEQYWKRKEKELNTIKLSKEEQKLRSEHVTINKGFNLLFYGVKGGFPEFSKTLLKLVDGIN